MADEHCTAASTPSASDKMEGDRQPASPGNGGIALGPDRPRVHRAGGEVLNGLIALCYDAGMGAQPWDRFLARLGGVLDCSGTTLMTQSTDRRDHWVLWFSGPALDPGDGCTAPTAECWCPGRAQRPFEAPASLRCLSGVVARRPDEAIILGAWRRRGADPFDEDDRRLFADVLPHVGRALDIHWFRQHCAAEGRPVRSVFDRLGEAVFIIDRDGRVTKSNRAADSMVKRRCGWLMIGDRLMPAATKYREVFRRSLDDVFSKDGSPRDVRTVRLALVGDLAAPPVPVAVTRLDRSSGLDERERPLAAVISKDPMRRPAMLTPELAETYQLTPSEARLASMIVSGFSLIDAAARLRISKNTARSHMKRIYFKTCTQNHADLIRTLSRSFLALFSEEDEQFELGDGYLLN